MLENYEKYLDFLNEKLAGFFDKQKDYIKCQKGCAKCCKNAEFPFSFIEFKYLLSGFMLLDKSTQDIIENNIDKVVEQKKVFDFSKNKRFSYDCPFLIDDVCSVYKYRGIVCRTFGLLVPDKNDENNTKIPFCYREGLNYSMVVDFETNTLSSKKFEETGFKTPPLGFNISHNFLTDKCFEKKYNFQFGEKHTLIDWFLISNN